jgi:hypothetical protein
MKAVFVLVPNSISSTIVLDIWGCAWAPPDALPHAVDHEIVIDASEHG